MDTNPEVDPRYRHYCGRCTCLGKVEINGVTADVFTCDDLVIARYGDAPGEAEAEHIDQLSLESSAFLLAAYRLYLDEQGKTPLPSSVSHLQRPIVS